MNNSPVLTQEWIDLLAFGNAPYGHPCYRRGLGGGLRLPSGKRIDFLDIKNGVIYELKPFNPRAMKAGQNQLNMYMKELQTMPEFKDINWKTVLDTY